MNRTENFIWHQENLIASGTRATIYQGFHRFSGEFVAVKVNKTQGDAAHRGYLTEIDDAEIRLIKDLRHENLVQFLVFERLEESTDQAELIGEQILFFEYCHGPSVDRLLQSPMFRYGLPCETFIELLNDLNEALRFLKSKNIVSSFRQTTKNEQRLFLLPFSSSCTQTFDLRIFSNRSIPTVNKSSN